MIDEIAEAALNSVPAIGSRAPKWAIVLGIVVSFAGFLVAGIALNLQGPWAMPLVILGALVGVLGMTFAPIAKRSSKGS